MCSSPRSISPPRFVMSLFGQASLFSRMLPRLAIITFSIVFSSPRPTVSHLLNSANDVDVFRTAVESKASESKALESKAKESQPTQMK
ncbi:hypothetical protein R1flu_022106 [Riccia fluitans]|uniref:Uncharacterized protein n=1 Tax=Riccia fluitans TaxID=41844 RepID=A0ABD1ZRB1_9MARC